MTAAAQELLARWKAWDAAPGAEHTARRMEDATQVFAAELGMTGSNVRIWLSRRRLAGLTHEACIAELVGDDE